MKVLPPIDPTTINTQVDGTLTVSTGLTTGCGTLYYMNKSNVGIMVLYDDGSTIVLPAWYARALTLNNKSLRQVFSQAYVLSQTNPPISQLYMEAFQKGEDTTGLYSGPIPYQNTVNGSVNSNVTSTSAIVNTGNPINTSIINVQPNDAASPTWTATNNGNLSIFSDNAGTLTSLVQLVAGASPAVKLAALGLFTQLLGGAQTDIVIPFSGDSLQLKSQSGTTQISLNDTVISVNEDVVHLNGKTLQWDNAAGSPFVVLWVDASNDTNLATVAAGAPILFKDETGAIMAALENQISTPVTVGGNGGLSVSKVFFNVGAIKDFNNGTVTTSGSVTVNHGLSGQPSAVWCDCTQSGSTATTSTYSYTTTQFTLLNGSGVSLLFRWLCYR